MIIGISGSRGSFSEAAAQQWMTKNGLNDSDISYLVSFEPLFEALDSGVVEVGIFPVFNSTMGLVKPAMHALARHHAEIEDFFDIDVVQCLLVQKGTERGAITTIVSQQPALDQCPQYIQREFPGVQLLASEDTAQAAANLAAGKYTLSTAAIAPKSCAEIYGLVLLEEGVQDLKHNFTSFLAVRKKSVR
jgi:prephenate dehydratase